MLKIKNNELNAKLRKKNKIPLKLALDKDGGTPEPRGGKWDKIISRGSVDIALQLYRDCGTRWGYRTSHNDGGKSLGGV